MIVTGDDYIDNAQVYYLLFVINRDLVIFYLAIIMKMRSWESYSTFPGITNKIDSPYKKFGMNNPWYGEAKCRQI